jgi:hypothetical protein
MWLWDKVIRIERKTGDEESPVFYFSCGATSVLVIVATVIEIKTRQGFVCLPWGCACSHQRVPTTPKGGRQRCPLYNKTLKRKEHDRSVAPRFIKTVT